MGEALVPSRDRASAGVALATAGHAKGTRPPLVACGRQGCVPSLAAYGHPIARAPGYLFFIDRSKLSSLPMNERSSWLILSIFMIELYTVEWSRLK